MKRDRWLYCLLLLSLSVMVGGCAPGKIRHILINELPVTGEGRSAVMLIRQGESTTAGVATEINKGDEVVTLPGVTAIVWLLGGSQLILAPETHIQLVNPNHIINLLKSTGEVIGRVFVKAKDSLRIDTEYSSASTEGTEFLVSRGPGDAFTVAVISGVVRMESKTAQFAPLRLSRLEEATVSPGAAPRKSVLESDRANEIIRWVNRVEQNAGEKEKLRLLPDVTGLPLELAQTKLRAAGVTVGKEVGSIEGNQPLGTVISQKPEAGARVGKGQGVVLVYRAEERVVPQLTGLAQNVALERIRNLRLVSGEIRPEITGSTEPGRVIRQDPPPFAKVAVNSVINIVVEAESVVVPNLENYQIDQARMLLSRAGLKVGSEKRQRVPNISAGTVIGQNPQPGLRVKKDSAVSLTIAETGVQVPSLVGMPYARALALLREVGLGSGNPRRYVRADMAVDTVISQSPSAGTLVQPGSTVRLDISQRPVVVAPPSRTPTIPQIAPTGVVISPALMHTVCTVPDIMGLTESAAVSRIEKARLVPRVRMRLSGPQVVTQQTPQGNATAACGNTVTFTIGTIQ
ncbi:PASTA domain-containing protein [Desulfopila sp. IMCC35006]|uniref:PASTA domain-containing protein n=1 Tax=Desulfopila sp. IMCC35006 TaxID=2569542 RepID=UPI0010AC1D15|nr:PASTA domain-containing protein [Desulfopila sp. IMCC35006]TKB24679.1 PASTA domain-containing protein [Desulfopila sp. IMCC35006]